MGLKMGSMRIAIAGRSGFVGAAVSEAGRARGATMETMRAPRLRVPRSVEFAGMLESWISEEKRLWEKLVVRAKGIDVLVNAAGLADPRSSDVEALDGANGVLPAVLAKAAAVARVPRFVHVSSAAVQGNRKPLDESAACQPFSPYSRSKALGEELLLEVARDLPLQIVIHRPMSVQGPTRPMTQRLVRLASRRVVPLCGDGDAPLPVGLIENVGAAIIFLATAPDPPTITLQPWEGMTARSLFEAFGDEPRFVSLPPAAWRAAAKAASWKSPAVGRRIELLAFGQRQEASALPTMGFEPPLVGPDAYRELAKRTRTHLERPRR